MMTNQLNIKQMPTDAGQRPLEENVIFTTRPDCENQQTRRVETTACGLKVVESPDDEVCEF
ncbi:hypothetical protein [Thiomicrospira microaerophila]|uniref:hypothetical protein n=1 Tax=Thiomicrospira microaerophila TaxID=406020 RepID=UPI0005C7F160|nr:hypothetical protein [Thiomicrospira microaerophila]